MTLFSSQWKPGFLHSMSVAFLSKGGGTALLNIVNDFKGVCTLAQTDDVFMVQSSGKLIPSDVKRVGLL